MKPTLAAVLLGFCLTAGASVADELPGRTGASAGAAPPQSPAPAGAPAVSRVAALQPPVSSPESPFAPSTPPLAPAPQGAPAAPMMIADGPASWSGFACQPRGGPLARAWVSGEYLLWWIKGAGAPPLVTANPAGTPRDLAGVLPGATVLYPGNSLDSNVRSGARFTGGFWFDDNQTLGVEGSFFFLGQQGTTFQTGVSTGDPVLGRPVFNPVLGREDAELVAYPGVLNGGVTVSSFTRLLGADGNLLYNVLCGPAFRLDLLGGYRYLRLEEGLGVTENLSVPAGSFAGSRIVVQDQFNTQNNFHGGQLGAKASYWRGRLGVDLFGKVALGVTQSTVNINGQTTFLVGTSAITQPGGLLALPTNMGRYHHNAFAVAPEATLRLGYRVTDYVQAFVGYTFLYVSDVARPGDQIDRVVNQSQIPQLTGPRPLSGPARPLPMFQSTDFWTQGINFGLEFRF